MTQAKRSSALGAVVAGLAAAAAYVLVVRPRLLAWGASELEARRALPGDDLVPEPRWQYTHAVTIRAPAAEVWRWLVQRGYRRAGWYTYDPLYKLLGADEFVDGHSADRIIPELQELHPGDSVPIAPGIAVPVVAAEPGQLLQLHAEGDPSRGPGAPVDPSAPGYMNLSWIWYLQPLDERTTRLIERMRLAYHPGLATDLMQRLFVEPGSFIMDRKMLLGIKQRAEAQNPLPPRCLGSSPCQRGRGEAPG